MSCRRVLFAKELLCSGRACHVSHVDTLLCYRQSSGHDSTEDAKAALQLALLKAANGPLFGVSKPDRQRCPVLEVVDLRTTSSTLIWQQQGQRRGGACRAPALAAVEEVVLPVGVAEEAEVAIVAVESEVTAVVHDGTEGAAVVAVKAASCVVTSSGVEDSAAPTVRPESCVGGNATCRYAPTAEAVVDALCEEVAASARGTNSNYEVVTTDDKSAGPVSSWVPVTPPGGAIAEGSTVESISVQKCHYIFGSITHPAYGDKAGEFAATVGTHLEKVRLACRGVGSEQASAGSTLLMVTAQDTLQPVLALMARKRALSKNTLATAMWGADDELRLRELRKHNLAYLAVEIL
jgi:hypothetical protein